MPSRRVAIALATAAALLVSAGCAPQQSIPLAAQLKSEDISIDRGWAGFEAPVTGGESARKEHIFRVRNRAQLVAALSPAGGTRDTPKVIYVEGTIDLSVDANNMPLAEADYRDAQFSWEAYAKAYDPLTWGKAPPTGVQEDARKRSAEKQAAVVVIPVGSNTSIIGVGTDALIKHGNLMVRDAQNVVLRNLAFEDAYDFFPGWDPKDNANGEWNSEYDNVTLYGARRVWVDHCTFSDGARPDQLNRSLFGRPMQFHDGLLDIVRGSDLITVSFSHFKNHDKGLLIGNSDNRADDDGKLRVTMHHNWFENIKERSPRVRFGRVHLYNNFYNATPGAAYAHSYSIGAGFKSRIIVENNWFSLSNRAASTTFKWWKADRIEARNNRIQTSVGDAEVNAAEILERQSSTPMSKESGWAVPYRYTVIAPQLVENAVRAQAGAGR